MEWGPLPGTGHWDAAFFCRFAIFKIKAPKHLRKIWTKISGKICALSTKNLRTKIYAICAKICAQISAEIVPKIGVKTPSFWKMKARKKKCRKNLRQICAKPQPQTRFETTRIGNTQSFPTEKAFPAVCSGEVGGWNSLFSKISKISKFTKNFRNFRNFRKFRNFRNLRNFRPPPPWPQ